MRGTHRASAFALGAAIAALPLHGRCEPAKPARIADIPAPPGYVRTAAPAGSFGSWLRSLPLKPHGTPVRLYDGRLKANQGAHHAVIDMTVGNRDLQQCADAIMRLRAEFLYEAGRRDEIRFSTTPGPVLSFAAWSRGYRPVITRGRLTLRRRGARDSSRTGLASYLETAYVWCGTLSLARDLVPAGPPARAAIGDVILQGGSPGHAVIAVDEARGRDGARVFLLAQSYMPAQDLHVLANPSDPSLSPWYRLPDRGPLETPEWEFPSAMPMRFPEVDRTRK